MTLCRWTIATSGSVELATSVLHPEDGIFYRIVDISAKLHGFVTQKALRISHHTSFTTREYNELHRRLRLQTLIVSHIICIFMRLVASLPCLLNLVQGNTMRSWQHTWNNFMKVTSFECASFRLTVRDNTTLTPEETVLLAKMTITQTIKKFLVLYKIVKLSTIGQSLPVQPKLEWPT